MEPSVFADLTKEIRKSVLEYAYKSKSSHIASNFSMIELLTALYYEQLNVSADTKFDPNRDRFILSKGHACLGLYIILNKLGFIDEATMNSYAVNGGALEHHPRRNQEMGVEVSSGSLGHGLGLGAGMAIAAKRDNMSPKIYVMMSDGEVDEGTIWEAAMFAAHHKLDNIIAIVDYNKMQALGNTKDVVDLHSLADKFKAFGWGVADIDGHNYHEIMDAFKGLPYEKGKPSVIISNTTKGRGVSFMEMNLLWHYKILSKEEYKAALEELEGVE